MADSWTEKRYIEKRTHMGYIWISVCSVFEGLQIIYSPFRRRELFSFDRFIWRWSSRAIAPRNIDDVYTHGPSRLFFFSLSLSFSLPHNPSSYAVLTPPSLSISFSFSLSAIGVLKNDPGHYFYAVLHLFFLFFLSGPAVIRVTTSPVLLLLVVVVVISAGAAYNVPYQRMCKN